MVTESGFVTGSFSALTNVVIWSLLKNQRADYVASLVMELTLFQLPAPNRELFTFEQGLSDTDQDMRFEHGRLLFRRNNEPSK